ncbi:MAG TPA: hypothetical protein VKS21_07240, partial [Spirochaetota bacterium]|nr:hypothetical protein [Spirochaetota bacterium]
LCSLLGSVTYTTAVFIWVVISCLLLLWFSFFKCRSRLIFTYTGLAVVISAGWFFAYHRPTHHQAPVLNLLALLKYTVAFLGNMYTNKLSVAMVYGAAGLLLFSSLSVLLGRKMVTAGRTDGGKELFIALMPWYTVILYALVNTLANAVARAGWGLKHAVTCRYANITLLFWLGLFLLLWNMIWAGKVGYRHKLRARIAVIIMVAVLVIFPMYKMGFSVVQWFKGTYTRESSLAGLSLQLDVPDARVLQKIIVWSAQEVIDRQPLMAATKHVPFDKQLVPEFYYGRRLTNAGDYTAVESKIIRATDLLEQNRKVCGKPLVEQPCFFLRGQTLNSPKLNYILVTDKQDKMIGAGLPGYPPWDLKDTSRPRDYWAAYFKTDIEPVKVKLWARTAAGDWLRLRIDSFKKKFKPVFF